MTSNVKLKLTQKRRFWISIILLYIGIILPMFSQKVYTLKECRELAVKNNIKMRDAQMSIDQARETEKNAFSKYFPNVSAGAVYFHSNDYLMKKDISLSDEEKQGLGSIISQMGLNPSALASLPSSYSFDMLKYGTAAQVMAMEPIYAGGQITAGNKLAKLQTLVKKLEMQQSKDEIVSSTETYYNQLITLFEKSLLNIVFFVLMFLIYLFLHYHFVKDFLYL